MAYPSHSVKKAHSCEDAKDPTKFMTPGGPAKLGAFWESRVRALKKDAETRSRETRDWKESPAKEQRRLQGKLNLFLVARVFQKMEMGDHLRLRQFPPGFPIAGDSGGAGGLSGKQNARNSSCYPDSCPEM